MALTPQQRRRMRFNQLLMMQMSMAAYASTKASWTPLELFTNNIVGAWYDPSDFSTMFQDSAGTTPVTAVEQPVGLHLDKSKGLALGAELVSNGGFDSDTVWAKGAGWTIGGGVASVNGATANADIFQAISVVDGKFYKITFDVVSISANGRLYLLDPNFQATAITTTGSKSYIVESTAARPQNIGLRALSSDASAMTASIDNISVREISGNHRYQSTSAARPTLSARYNVLTKTEEVNTIDWTAVGATIIPPTKVAADEISYPAVTGAGDASVLRQGFTSIATTYLGAIELKAKAAGDVGKQVAVYLNDGSITNITFHTLTDTYTRVTVSEAVSATTVYFTVGVLGSSFGGVGNQGACSVNMRYADARVTSDGVGLPAYQRVNTSTDYDTSGFPMYLKYDGTDDFMQTAAVDFSGTDKLSVFCGARKLSTSVGIIAEVTANYSLNTGSAYLVGGLNPGDGWHSASRGAATANANQVASSSDGTPITGVLTSTHDISGDSTTLRVNGVAQTSATGDKGSGNFANAAIYFGGRGGASLFFNGREYQTIIRGAASTATEIAAAELYVNNRTKAY